MGVRRVTMEQFAKTIGDLPKELEPAIVRGLQSAGHRGVLAVVEAINSPNPVDGTPPAVDEGTLMRSVSFEPSATGGRIVVDAPHASYMDLGTRPFTPPLKPLFDWARRKFGVDASEAWRIAFAVRRKIALRGLKPRHFMMRAMFVIGGKIVFQEIERELQALD